jgi:RNA polymerase sigma factor (sigma-70 family)
VIKEDDFPEIYSRVSKYVRVRVPHPDCEDVVGDIILALCGADFRGESSFETFQFSIMRKKVVDWMRKKIKERESYKKMTDELEISTPPSFVDLVEQRQVMERFWSGLDSVSEKQQKIMKMFYHEGKTIVDIADILVLSPRMVTQHRNSALRKMIEVYVRRTNALRDSKKYYASRKGSRPSP